MRHGISGRKFNRTSSERKALFLNLAKSLLTHEQIKTTLPKAKDLRPIIERIITKARVNTLHNRRQLISELRDPALVEHLMTKVAPRFAQRPGGYTRILKAGFRYGDNAPLAVIEFVDFDATAPRQEAAHA
jgi:large subunit ribosomal protein L17